MTSLPSIGPEHPQHLDGRTVRDIVEYSPGQVDEVWCRKIFRHLLQSLELQYGMHMPRRAITPDTIVFHDNGEPLLIPSDLPTPKRKDGAPDDPLRDDLTALAGVVHYAITHELAPSGPLRGRALDGYSESLVTAVDRCMAPDPAQRPRTIAALRDILGIVALGPAGAPPSTPAPPPAADPPLSFMSEADGKRPETGLSLWQRRAIAAGAGAILLAVAVAWFAELRDTTSFDHIVLTLPQQPDPPRAPAAPSPAAPATPAPATAAASTPAPAAPALPAAAPPHAGPATYFLRIQPWGVVYVDGVDRGVSPPVKRLALTPGRHTVRVTNPNFNDRVLEVDTASGDGRIAVDFNLETP